MTAPERKYATPVWLGICPTTGKRSYPSRKAARRAARQLRGPMGRMNAYQCECGMWHMGHLPGAIVAGHMGREEITRGTA